MIVYSGSKPASSSFEGRTSSVRMNRLCQASSLMTRTLTRCSGCEPPKRSATYSLSLPASAARKSSFNAAKCAGSMATFVLPHQILFSVSASRTINLSFAERPVCAPVLTTSGPFLASVPSPLAKAASTRGAVPRLAKMLAFVEIPCFSSGILRATDITTFSNRRNGLYNESRAYVCNDVSAPVAETKENVKCYGLNLRIVVPIGRS